MTELEMSTLDWLIDLLGLPQHFKNAAEGPGCGIIQSTASDATLIAIFAARATAVEVSRFRFSFLFPMKMVGTLEDQGVSIIL